MFVVFDWDGTLSDDRHRHHLLPVAAGPDGSWDYTAYHEACVNDAPIVPMLRALFAHMVAGHRVEIWTGRNRSVEGRSREWLARNLRYLGIPGLPADLKIKMREGEGPVVELKRSWLHALPPYRRPHLAYDDRADCAEMWRAEGVACAHVELR